MATISGFSAKELLTPHFSHLVTLPDAGLVVVAAGSLPDGPGHIHPVHEGRSLPTLEADGHIDRKGQNDQTYFASHFLFRSCY